MTQPPWVRDREALDWIGAAHLVVTRNDGSIVQANRLAAELFGYDRGELLGRPIEDLLPLRLADDHVAHREAYWEEPRQVPLGNTHDCIGLRRDGTEFRIEIALNPLRHDGEDHTSVLVCAVPSTTPGHIRLADLVSCIDGIIFEADPTTVSFLFVSQKAETILGYPCERWTSDPGFWPSCILPEDRERAIAFCRQATTQGLDHQMEYRMRAADGRIVWIRDIVSVQTRDGVPVRMSGVMIDITEQKLAEEQRQRLEERLRQAQKMESLAILAGGVAHDFNNLLVGILGNVGLARLDLTGDSPVAAKLGDIEQAALKAAELTRQMLDYAGKGRSVLLRIDLNRQIEEMAQLLEAAIGKTAEVSFELADDLPLIEADPAQIGQLVMNLLTNAADAIDSDDGRIRVSTRLIEADAATFATMFCAEDVEPGTYLSLRVSDTGCGMDEQTRARMFDPFFSTKFSGRGLGLASTLGILRSHHGAIQVVSRPGQGTTITALFPAAPRGDARATPPAIDAGAARRPRHRGAVLVIDDDEMVCAVLHDSLARGGFSPTTASDAETGLQLFAARAEHWQLVILDLTMPRMGGEQIYRRLREIAPAVPVLLMSGYSESQALLDFDDKGLLGFLQKPFQPDELSALLDRIVATAADDSTPVG